MSLTDPIADLLTRIRNAHMVNKASVKAPASKLKLSVLKILKEQGYITNYSTRQVREGVEEIDIELKYFEGKPAIVELKKVTTPGRRVYTKSQDLKRVKGGLGIAIVSTSKGLMIDSAAREANIGGEVLCSVY